MLATVFNLPKWLLVAVVFCVLAGHCQQIECKLFGCPAVAVDAGEKTTDHGHADSSNGEKDCGCQCHFSASACFEVPQVFTALRLVQTVKLVERMAPAPEAPCAKIEYPPRSRCA